MKKNEVKWNEKVEMRERESRRSMHNYILIFKDRTVGSSGLSTEGDFTSEAAVPHRGRPSKEAINNS